MFGSVLAACTFAASALAATTAEWQQRSIYQVCSPFPWHALLTHLAIKLVTDRFATSDGSSPACDTSDRVYCGGSWQGVINKLDYIQYMGFDAIWISPVVKNLEGSTGDGYSYHGSAIASLTLLGPELLTRRFGQVLGRRPKHRQRALRYGRRLGGPQ